jgi:protein unc-45
LKLHDGENDLPLLALCRRYALYHDSKAGDDAADYLKGAGPQTSGPVAVECLKLVLETSPSSLSSAQDIIITQLVRQNQNAREYFATEFLSSTTEFFDNIYDRGDDSANCLRTIVLDPQLWPSEEIRLQVEDDLFQLLLAKLMESGHDLDGRALRGIALLLMADVNRLSAFIDQQGFDAILSSLDIRLPADVRSQATIVASKYLELSEEDGRKYFTEFVTTRVAKQKAEPMVVAFSAAAAIFPIATAVTAPLFLTAGFLQSLIPLLERKLKNAEVHDTFLQLLNAACVDSACRAAIAKHCSGWLSHKVSNGNGNHPAVAATILAKLRASKTEIPSDSNTADEEDDVQELVNLFKKGLMGEAGSDGESIEGLAFASLKPEVKEELSQDPAFLRSLCRVLDKSNQRPEIVVGGLSVISNITQYPPNLSDEQKKMAELKAYANATKLPSTSNLEDDAHIAARCYAVMQAEFVPVFIRLKKNSSSSVKRLIDGILLSIAKTPKNRGRLAQQGAVKILIEHLTSGESAEAAGHALARILISVDPSHVFPSSGSPHITSAVGPLVAMLSPAPSGLQDQPRDLLPVFESLLALTNLASSPDVSAANLIVRTAWDNIEDLLLSNNSMIRRATSELVCNLVTHDAGAAKYLDGSKRSHQRLHVLLALADVDDMATRRAASGALAMLTQEPSASTNAILDIKRGPEILLGLCSEGEEEEVMHRGLVCLRNLSCAPEPAGTRARQALRELGGVEAMKACLRRTHNPAILQVGVEAMKALVK